MTYSYETYNSDTIDPDNFKRLEQFILVQSSNHPALKNMGWDPSGGFLYNVYNRLRWRTDQGKIYTVTDNEDIVAISCVEFPEGATNWAIGGIRTWVVPAHRQTHLPSYVLSKQVDWARKHDCDFMLLTFNDYNRVAHTTVTKRYESKAGWSTWWDDCLAVPDTIVVRNVHQWGIIKPVLCADNSKNLQTLKRWQTRHK